MNRLPVWGKGEKRMARTGKGKGESLSQAIDFFKCYTAGKEIKPFNFSSSQFQFGNVDVFVVQAFLVKRNKKLLAIATCLLVHILFCSFSLIAS